LSVKGIFTNYAHLSRHDLSYNRQRCKLARIPTASRNRREITMRNTHTLSALTLLNLVLLILVLSHHAAPVQASGPESVLRGRALEVVDAQGRVRASISINPEGPARKADGSPTEWGDKIFPEAVVFRLIRPDGRPSVKIATTEQGSGLDLSGGIDPTYIVLTTEGGDASLTVTNKDGRHQVIKP